MLRKEFAELAALGAQLWTPSYFAASAGGAPIERLMKYREDQEKPSRRAGFVSQNSHRSMPPRAPEAAVRNECWARQLAGVNASGIFLWFVAFALLQHLAIQFHLVTLHHRGRPSAFISPSRETTAVG